MMFFDPRAELAKIRKEAPTPATSATSATQAPQNPLNVAKVADVAAPQHQKPETLRGDNQRRDTFHIMRLSRQQQEAHQIAERIHQCHDFSR